MTEPLVSILLPHLRNASNDAALRVCLDCLVANTTINYELLVESVAERRDIYRVINRMARRVVTNWIIPWNTDVFAAPGWIEPLWAARAEDAIVSPVLVECGAIPVNDRNLERDFGRTPNTFRRAEFEAWVADGGGWRADWQETREGWYWPSLLSTRSFLLMKGFDTHLGGFPEPLDMDFHQRWRDSGRQFKRVRSYLYHLQNFSTPERGVRV